METCSKPAKTSGSNGHEVWLQPHLVPGPDIRWGEEPLAVHPEVVGSVGSAGLSPLHGPDCHALENFEHR